ncbi:DUF397 domain-containing protein [Streptomyces sp. NBC_01506]|uniref:DUF397 domain-containing protein n=1 Tax=Streptomyces sp. NBC_01506 TaxID=2903887 RepID=UPI0038696694
MKSHSGAATAPGLAWVKSSYSGNNGNCVEVAALPDGSRRLPRDSKRPHGPALALTAGLFDSFVRTTRRTGSARANHRRQPPSAQPPPWLGAPRRHTGSCQLGPCGEPIHTV